MQLLDLGKKDYSETLQLQKELVEKRANDEIEDTLILVEHPWVYTAGRALHESTTKDENGNAFIKVKNHGFVPIVECERGGKMTFHGPGQLVGYPIFKLSHQDLRRYLRDLERILMACVQEQALLPAKPCPETLLLEPGQLQTGVWILDRKVASIGIAVKKWVTYHGFALNVFTDLKFFEAIDPCGFQGSIMTSLKKELGPDVLDSSLMQNIKKDLSERFKHLSTEYSSEVELKSNQSLNSESTVSSS
jgi:lipoate-protein ligase B